MSYGDIAAMAEKSNFDGLFDVNDPAFMAPKSMSGAIKSYLEESGKAVPKTDADYFSSAYHSLACCYADAIGNLEKNVKKEYSEIYIVGGGAKNGYLNGLTEMYTGRRVVTMPIEATAIGNLIVQMNRLGEIVGGEAEEETAQGWE